MAIETSNISNFSVVFEFERQWEDNKFRQWMDVNWTLCYVASAAYVVVVFGGKWYMQNKKGYDLRPFLFLWSLTLALFSIFGAVRTVPELIRVTRDHGVKYSVCVPSYFDDKVTAFWAFMFTVSKVYELGDTIFIILRKQHLIFLHWYHHISVLIYVWYSYTEKTAPGRWFMCMNYTVHAFMYSYYAARALRWFRIPVQVNMVITVMQISQMVVGSIVNIWVYQIKVDGEKCSQSFENLRYSTLMYLSYFFLFAQFFYNAYMKPKDYVKKQK